MALARRNQRIAGVICNSASPAQQWESLGLPAFVAQPFLAVSPCRGSGFNKGKKAKAANRIPIDLFRHLFNLQAFASEVHHV
jgi:hypothetical protein